MRVLFEITSTKKTYNGGLFSFFINDFPERPMVGDLLDFPSLVTNVDNLSDEEADFIFLDSEISYMIWERDDNGIFLKVTCEEIIN